MSGMSMGMQRTPQQGMWTGQNNAGAAAGAAARDVMKKKKKQPPAAPTTNLPDRTSPFSQTSPQQLGARSIREKIENPRTVEAGVEAQAQRQAEAQAAREAREAGMYKAPGSEFEQRESEQKALYDDMMAQAEQQFGARQAARARAIGASQAAMGRAAGGGGAVGAVMQGVLTGEANFAAQQSAMANQYMREKEERRRYSQQEELQRGQLYGGLSDQQLMSMAYGGDAHAEEFLRQKMGYTEEEWTEVRDQMMSPGSGMLERQKANEARERERKAEEEKRKAKNAALASETEKKRKELEKKQEQEAALV